MNAMAMPETQAANAPARKRVASKPSKMRWLMPGMVAAVILGYAISQYHPAPELPEQVVLQVHGLH